MISKDWNNVPGYLEAQEELRNESKLDTIDVLQSLLLTLKKSPDYWETAAMTECILNEMVFEVDVIYDRTVPITYTHEMYSTVKEYKYEFLSELLQELKYDDNVTRVLRKLKEQWSFQKLGMSKEDYKDASQNEITTRRERV